MTESRRDIRQSDVASAAGVSQATVSLVLKGSERISESTRARVLSVIADLGYSPNAAARLLRHGRSNLIGIYTYAPVFPVRAEDYFHEFLLGVERAAVERGNDVVLFASTEDADGLRRIYTRGENRLRLADGAIVFGAEYDADELARLARDRYPFVVIGRREIAGVDAPYVTADYRRAAAETAVLLHARGHRRVAYLAGAVRREPLMERWNGFRDGAENVGVEVAVQIEVVPESLNGALVDQLLAKGVTCVVVETVTLADRLAAVLQSQERRVPRDLSAVFLDRGPKQWGDAVSAIGVPREAMGRASVDLLLRHVDGESLPKGPVVLPCEPPSVATIASHL